MRGTREPGGGPDPRGRRRFSDNNTANWRKGSIYDVEKTKIIQVDMDNSEVAATFRLRWA